MMQPTGGQPDAPSKLDVPADVLSFLPTCTHKQQSQWVRDCGGPHWFVPCTGTASTVWFTCMNPVMTALYPGYPADFSDKPTTPYLWPKSSTQRTTESVITKTLIHPDGVEFYWQQYNTMNHYCARWLANTSLDTDSKSGYNPNGLFVQCANDPMSYAERDEFCTSKQPWWVLEGQTLETLSIEDLCPFIDVQQNPDGKYCVLFADHPLYPTVQSLISVNLPPGVTWSAVTFTTRRTRWRRCGRSF